MDVQIDRRRNTEESVTQRLRIAIAHEAPVFLSATETALALELIMAGYEARLELTRLQAGNRRVRIVYRNGSYDVIRCVHADPEQDIVARRFSFVEDATEFVQVNNWVVVP